MRISTAPLLGLLSLLTLPSAIAANTTTPHPPACLTSSLAATIADNFDFVVSQYASDPARGDRLANTTLVPDFVDFTDSVRELMTGGCSPQPQPVFASRAAVVAAQRTGPQFQIVRLNLWYSCDEVVARWAGLVGAQNITGIFVLETIPPPRGMVTDLARVVKRGYSEFNSGAWLKDLGILKPSCAS